MAETYVSTDVEADGPIPGIYSMLSFGSAAYTAEKKLLGTFSANLETLPAGRSPFGHSALDIKTYAMALLRKPYRESTKRNMPARWFDRLPHTHVAVDDAAEQGALFCNMLSENVARRRGAT